jgi:hypothetical protein
MLDPQTDSVFYRRLPTSRRAQKRRWQISLVAPWACKYPTSAVGYPRKEYSFLSQNRHAALVR